MLRNASYQPFRNGSVIINGRKYVGHALDQMQNRGIMPSVVENTIKYGNRFAGRTLETTLCYEKTNNVTVILNEAEEVVTSYFGLIN